MPIVIVYDLLSRNSERERKKKKRRRKKEEEKKRRKTNKQIKNLKIKKAFIQRKGLSLSFSNRIHAHIYTQAPAHTSILTTQNLIYSQLNQIINKDLRRRKIAARSGKHGRSIVFLEKETMSWGYSECMIIMSSPHQLDPQAPWGSGE